MLPILLSTPLFSIYTFGVVLLVAFFAAAYFMKREMERAHFDFYRLERWTIIFFLTVFIPARIFYLLHNLEWYAGNPWNFLFFWDRGFDFFGGILGLMIFFYFYARGNTSKFRKWLDISVPAILAFMTIFRVGNLLDGQNYFGRPTDSIIGIVINNVDFTLAGLSIYPLPLIEIFFLALFYLIWRVLFIKKFARHSGRLFFHFVWFYALLRFILEFYRFDVFKISMQIADFTVDQIYAGVLLLIYVGIFIYRRLLHR